MSQKADILNSPEVDKLMTMVEEATRATKDSPRRFIEPARGTLDRAKSRRHHTIFGRRGSGKTSLLRKAGSDLTLGRIPVAFVDLEAFKGHTYPDVLISVLIETIGALDSWLASAGSAPASKTSFSKKFFGKPDRPPLDPAKVAAVRAVLAKYKSMIRRCRNAILSLFRCSLTSVEAANDALCWSVAAAESGIPVRGTEILGSSL